MNKLSSSYKEFAIIGFCEVEKDHVKIPQELILKIFSYLKNKEPLRRVCKGLAQLFKENLMEEDLLCDLAARLIFDSKFEEANKISREVSQEKGDLIRYTIALSQSTYDAAKEIIESIISPKERQRAEDRMIGSDKLTRHPQQLKKISRKLF